MARSSWKNGQTHSNTGGGKKYGQDDPKATPPGGYQPGTPGSPAPYPGGSGGTPSAVETGATPSDYVNKPAPPSTPTVVNLIDSILPSLSPAERLFASAAVKAGARYNVSPALLMGLIKQESGFDPEHVGPKTSGGRARGSTGFLPKTARDYGVEYGTSKKAIQSQVDGAAKYLAELDVNNNPERAINKYGAGGGRAYIKPVEKAARQYGALDRIAAGSAWKFAKSPDHPTAPVSVNAALGGRVVRQAVRGRTVTGPVGPIETGGSSDGSGPVNTERPELRGRRPAEGPRNTERPDPISQVDPRVRRVVKGVMKATQAIAEGETPQPQHSPAQRRRVRKRLERAVGRSGGKFLDDTLNPAQQEWARAFAKELGVSLQFAAAEALREGGNGTPGDNNWANIGWTDSGPTAITRDPVWRDPTAAGKATADWIRGKFGQRYGYVAADGIQEIGRLADAGASEQQIGRQWANSGWASAGAGPLDTYGQVPISEGGRVDPALVQKARQVLGPLNTKAILNEVDLSGVQRISDPAQRRAAKEMLVTGKPSARAEALLGKAAARALANGGEIVKAPKGKRKLAIAEMFYDPGISLDSSTAPGTTGDAQPLTEIGPIGGHGDHVHISSTDPWTMLTVIAKAQSLGMLQGGVGENPVIDTLDGNHVAGSFHYESEKIPQGRVYKKLVNQVGGSGKVVGQGLDVAGTPEQMAKLNQWVAAHAGKNVGPQGPKIRDTDLRVVVPTEGVSGSTGGVTAGGVTGGSGGIFAAGSPSGGKRKEDRYTPSVVDLGLPFAARARLPDDPRQQEEEDPLVAAFANFRPKK